MPPVGHRGNSRQQQEQKAIDALERSEAVKARVMRKIERLEESLLDS